MKLYFATISETSSAEQCDAITNYIKQRGWGYWHHIGNSWIIATKGDDDLTAGTLRDTLLEYAPGCINLVVEFTVEDWGAYSPSSTHDWLRSYFSPKNRHPVLPGFDPAAPDHSTI